MARLNSLEDVLFPVSEHPVYVILPDKSGERRVRVDGKKAIVNRIKGNVVGVVSEGYRLITNQEALELAKQCCQEVFPDTKSKEWGVHVVDAPSTGGHCFIDLVHNSAALDFNYVPASERPDAFGPFIRVTNSYNGLRALSFDIGFYRKVCMNGMILPKSVIRFSFIHLRHHMKNKIIFDVARDRLEKLNASFSTYLGSVKSLEVPVEEFEPLFKGVLYIRTPKKIKPFSREDEDWKKLNAHISNMCIQYAWELGYNGYAVFNAITEFASNPPANRFVYRDRHSMQRLAGMWLNDFSHKCSKPGFSISGYISEWTESLDKRVSEQMGENPRIVH